MATATGFTILDPVQAPVVEDTRLAPRLRTLDGAVIGLFRNHKRNAGELLDMVAGVLSERYQVKEVVRSTFKNTTKLQRGDLKDLDRCNLAVVALGD